ncbi:hypothetical protein WJX74_001793 [Apatococcus lobatus]|uniref:Protein kinase domain-containing protein n=2 Tax=Apatococcus TaxID=904362 RepID=A0AAW1T1F3_9CHLO
MAEGGRKVGQWLVTGEIGSGSFATVWRAQHEGTGNEVAIKEIRTDRLNDRLRQSLESEVAILQRIDHKNIVHLKQVLPEKNKLCLIMEFCAGGDLSGHIKRPENRRGIPEAQARQFMQQLAAGLQELWSHNMVHRDLKPHNLLLSDASPQAVLKIADFGFARLLQPHGLADTLCGSPLYMAPEILQHRRYDAKADLWSVGTIFFELLTGRPPFSGANYLDLTRNILNREAAIPSQLSTPCKKLLHGLLRRNPVERISFEEFFSHSFLTGVASVHDSPAPEQPAWNGPHAHTSGAWRAGPAGASSQAGSRRTDDEGMHVSSEGSSGTSSTSLYTTRPHLPAPGLTPGEEMAFMVDEEEETQALIDIATSLPLPGIISPHAEAPSLPDAVPRYPGTGIEGPSPGSAAPHHLADSDEGWTLVPTDIPATSSRGAPNAGLVPGFRRPPTARSPGSSASPRFSFPRITRASPTSLPIAQQPADAPPSGHCQTVTTSLPISTPVTSHPLAQAPPVQLPKQISTTPAGAAPSFPIPVPSTPVTADVVMGTSADSGSDVTTSGLGISGGREVPLRPLPAMRMTWKELHSAAKVLESVAEAQQHQRRPADTLAIHLMAMQLLDLAMKGFCTNSRGIRIEASQEQLPSTAEVQKLESKLRTVVGRAEEVEHALRRQAGTRQLPEVWELLYKVARDMSRAAGAEELVNSLQTAAESYLVAGFLFKFMAAQAPYLPLQPPIDLAPADRVRLHDYAITARTRRNACHSSVNPASSPAPMSPSRPNPTSSHTRRSHRDHTPRAIPSQSHRRSSTTRKASPSGHSGTSGDPLRRDASMGAASGGGLSNRSASGDGQLSGRQVSCSSMSGDFGRASSMGRALSNAAETLPMLAGSTGSTTTPAS